MKKIRGGWICIHCDHKSKEAHILSLIDYILLISPTITNKQARFFLLVESHSITKKLLTSLNLQCSGSNRNREYDLSKLLQDE
jgi:hypothetical protein